MPEKVAAELDKIQARFIWGGTDEKRKIHLASWNKASCPKKAGGLGFKKIRVMNECLLIKWWWRFGCEGNSLWRKVIKAKYEIGSISYLPNVEASPKASRVWVDILLIGSRFSNFSNFFKDNLVVRVGNGRDISFWHDKWLGGLVLREVFPRLFTLTIDKKKIGFYAAVYFRWQGEVGFKV